MYVITFYSFKGGVGRTMALVNVAAELVRRGRKVLVVDFDLEAPGLETYKHLQPPKPHPGIVEYIAEYRRTNAVPNLLDFIFETKPIGKRGGRLWVMPAGRRDLAYRRALSKLDWQRLYKDEEGFLLFEDTKMGWAEELKPDYVLIDSRTGDTEVLGICTRQLPDSVVLMFTPNEQNLAGLENVVRDIRREETEGLKKRIRLHFVAANVPDLDDEKRILRRQLEAFRERLGFKDLSGVIRRYENLNLLDQSVFTLDRPHSRLARSYRRFLRTVLKDNLGDRWGAIAFLQDYREHMEARDEDDFGDVDVDQKLHGLPEGFGSIRSTREVDGQVFASDNKGGWIPNRPQLEDRSRLSEIGLHFKDDAEIVNKVAERLVWEKGHRQAVQVLDHALAAKPNAVSLYQRAVCKINLGELDGAASDLLACYRAVVVQQSEGPIAGRKAADGQTLPSSLLQSLQNYTWAQDCLQIFGRIAPASKLTELEGMVERDEIEPFNLSLVIQSICQREDGVGIAARLVRREISRYKPVYLTSMLLARCWQEVIQLQGTGTAMHEFGTPEIQGASSMLCLALAHWGADGELPETFCKQVLEQLEAIGENNLHDFAHCWGWEALCLLLWRTGSASEAIAGLDNATHKAHTETGEVFSLWRLRRVPVLQYLEDCQLWLRLFQGEPLRPAFLGPAPA